MSKDFLSPLRFYQKLTASCVKAIKSDQRLARKAALDLMGHVFRSRQEILDAIDEVDFHLYVLCILEQKPFGSKDREFINAIQQNQMGITGDVISDMEK